MIYEYILEYLLRDVFRALLSHEYLALIPKRQKAKLLTFIDIQINLLWLSIIYFAIL